jgi:DNA-binding MarR family transcriptional regulator
MKNERIAKATNAKGSIDWRGVAEVDHPSESPGYLLWRVSAAWQRRIRAALKPYGITHAQFVLLTCLAWLQDRYEAPVTQVALADQAGLDKVTTGDVLATLEKANLVKRRPHATDKRAWEVASTPAGRAKVARALPDVVAVDRAFFGTLAKEGESFLRLMQRLDSAAQDR